ncbi:hypothetical protein T12_3116, partial [Trichinella patagoniensis]
LNSNFFPQAVFTVMKRRSESLITRWRTFPSVTP